MKLYKKDRTRRVFDMLNKYPNRMKWAWLMRFTDERVLIGLAGMRSPLWILICLSMHKNTTVSNIAQTTLHVINNTGGLK
jgi:hypothetical protein